MANILKEMYSSFYLKRVLGLYSLYSSNRNEAIYYYENKIAIIIRNEEIGKNLKDCLEAIKKEGYISLKKVLPPEFLKLCNLFEAYDIVPQWCKVTNYYIDDEIVRWVNIKTDSHELRSFLTHLRVISESQEETMILAFMHMFNELGLVLEKERFDSDGLNESVTKFASYFVKKEKANKKVDTYECWIRYYHYRRTGKDDFFEFYKNVDSEVFVSLKEFKYDFNIVRMFYNYYLTQKLYFPRKLKQQYSPGDYTIVKSIGWEDVCTETKDFFIYSKGKNNVKIIKDMKSDFQIFLIKNLKFLKKTNLTLNTITSLVINLDEELLGYTFEKNQKIKYYKTIDNAKFNDFNQIIRFLTNLLEVAESKKIIKNNESYPENKLSSLLVYNNKKTIVKFKDCYNLFLYFKIPIYERRKMIIEYVFQVYLEYINSKYDMKYDLKSLYKIPEIRYLDPNLAQSFCTFILNGNVDYIDNSYIELLTFFKENKSHYELNKLYSNYLPSNHKFYFDYELEDIKNLKSFDSKDIVFFNKPCSFIEVNRKVNKNYSSLEESGIYENENIKFITYQELIFSKNICEDGSYECLGGIPKKSTGIPFSIEMLSKFNNRELLKIFAVFFSEFKDVDIPLEFISIDKENYVFYINTIADNFKVENRKGSLTNKEYFNKLFKEFIDKGYNPNAFIGLKIPDRDLKNKWTKLANEMNNYCSEHKIYYKGKICHACKAKKYYPNFEGNVPFFSDEYADYYHIKENNKDKYYNLKVYKKNRVNIKLMENQVDDIINLNLIFGVNFSGQDCFIPYKKAINSNGEFIGYIYNMEDFIKDSENGIDIENLDAMPNLHRIKSLIRIILQVKNLVENGYGFIYNPYGKVFLNRSHKKQVQIANIDFLSKEADKENTLEWTRKYVENIINNDETIKKEIELTQNQNLSEVLQNLQNIAKNMTKFCKKHQIYYRDNYSLCPKCMKERNICMKEIELERIDVEKITNKGEIDEGGESYIYNYGKNRIAKILKTDEINYDLKFDVLIKMTRKSAILQKINEQNEKFEYVAPEKLIVDSKTNNVTGYIMKKVKNAYPLSALSDKKLVEKCRFSRNDILEMLIAIGKGIEILHNENIFIGDLNGRNILFDKNKKIYFIDFDGMGIEDISPEFCTDGYIDPESKRNQNITPNDDWYSFAIQAFYYLTYTHPFNGVFVDDNGKMLDITEKMERRISLLGNHGIEVPEIAESWDWMSYELVIAFKKIFEGKLRESIVQYLVNQYNILNEIDIPETEPKLVRINEKFVLEKINPFTNKMNYFISEDIAISLKKAECITYYKQACEYELPEVNNYRYIEKAVIVDNYMIAIQDELSNGFHMLYIIELDEQKIVYSTEIIPDTFYTNNNIVYYLKEIANKNYIEEVKLNGMETSKFRLPYSKKNLKKIKRVSDTKFVMVRSMNTNCDAIYCNNKKLFQIECTSDLTEYNILYDKYSKNWIVINSEGHGVFINASGGYKGFELDNTWMSNENLKNVSYIKNNLYIPNNRYLVIVKMPEIFIKKMKCNKISLNSRICSSNNKGFRFITEGILYEIHKE